MAKVKTKLAADFVAQDAGVRKVGRLLASHLRLKERAVALFDRSGKKLAEAAALPSATDHSVVLPDGRKAVIEDVFADGKTQVFRAKAFSRFEAKVLKPEKETVEN